MCRLWFAMVMVLFLACGGVLAANTYPTRPIRMVISNGPGAAHVSPLRTNSYGRVYRVVWQDGPATPIRSLAGASATALVAALDSGNLFWRETAQRLIERLGLAQLEHHMQVFELLLRLEKRLHTPFDRVRFLDDLLGLLVVVPEPLARHQHFDLAQAALRCGDVKETSATASFCHPAAPSWP